MSPFKIVYRCPMFCTLSWCLIFWGFIHRKTMKFNIFINIFLSVREISISGYMMTSLIIPCWTFKERSVFATLLRRHYFVSFQIPGDHALFVKDHERNMWNKERWRASLQSRERSAERDVNSCDFHAFWVEWSLNSCKFQVCNSFFWFCKNYF